MVERRDTHCHVDPCVQDEALLFGAKWICWTFLAAASLFGFSISLRLTFLCESYCLGLSATNQE